MLFLRTRLDPFGLKKEGLLVVNSYRGETTDSPITSTPTTIYKYIPQGTPNSNATAPVPMHMPQGNVVAQIGMQHPTMRCHYCASVVIVRQGRHGLYWACIRYATTKEGRLHIHFNV